MSIVLFVSLISFLIIIIPAYKDALGRPLSVNLDREVSSHFVSAIYAGLRAGVEALQDDKYLIPLSVVETYKGKTETKAFDVTSLERSLLAARREIRNSIPRCRSYLLIYDGYYEHHDKRFHAVYVEGAEIGAGNGFKFAQRYIPAALHQEFELVGRPIYLGTCENLMLDVPSTASLDHIVSIGIEPI